MSDTMTLAEFCKTDRAQPINATFAVRAARRYASNYPRGMQPSMEQAFFAGAVGNPNRDFRREATVAAHHAGWLYAAKKKTGRQMTDKTDQPQAPGRSLAGREGQSRAEPHGIVGGNPRAAQGVGGIVGYGLGNSRACTTVAVSRSRAWHILRSRRLGPRPRSLAGPYRTWQTASINTNRPVLGLSRMASSAAMVGCGSVTCSSRA